MLITVFGYLYASVFMTMHTLSWSQLADVDTDVSSINTAAEATTVSNKLYQQGILLKRGYTAASSSDSTSLFFLTLHTFQCATLKGWGRG